jgi:hypothetical protein
MDDFRAQRERTRKTINNWPLYKRMSIIREGHVVPRIPATDESDHPGNGKPRRSEQSPNPR